MSTVQRVQAQGTLNAQRLQQRLATELRDARLGAAVSQESIGRASGLSQSHISRIELAQAPGATVLELARQCAALGLRLDMRTFPIGSPVRDAGQLRLLERFRRQLHDRWRWASEVLVGTHGDLRAWDVLLAGPGTVGVDAETRLYDLQALQRRVEAKARDSGVDRIVLLVAETRHNGRVLREHREALRSTVPADTAEVLGALRRRELPPRSGLVVL